MRNSAATNHYNFKDDLNRSKSRLLSCSRCPPKTPRNAKASSDLLTPPPSNNNDIASADFRLLDNFNPDNGKKAAKKRLRYPFTYVDASRGLASSTITGPASGPNRIYRSSGSTRLVKALEKAVVLLFGLFFIAFAIMQIPAGAKMFTEGNSFMHYYFLWAVGLVVIAGIGTIIIAFTINANKTKYATLSAIATLVFILSLGNMLLLRLGGQPEKDRLGNIYFLNLEDGMRTDQDPPPILVDFLNGTLEGATNLNDTSLLDSSAGENNETVADLFVKPGFVPPVQDHDGEEDEIKDTFIPVNAELKGPINENTNSTMKSKTTIYKGSKKLKSSWESLFPPYLLGTLGTSLAMVAALIAFQCMMFLLVRKPKYEVYTLVDPSFYDTPFILRRCLSNSEHDNSSRDPPLVDYNSRF